MWSGILRAAILWSKTSKWRKLSKCKTLVKQLQMHLTIQKNRRDSMARQERIDISLLLQDGQLLQALPRVEKLHKDQSLAAAYDQMDHFCSCIITNISHLFNHKTVQDLPRDVGEAAASLVFAASRCGELPELRLLRDMLKEQYGWEFDIINVELRPWNLVNSQLKEKLCINEIPDYLKQDIISDLMKKSNVQLALENSKSTTPQRYILADGDFKYEQKSGGIQIQVPKSETERKSVGIVCSLSNGKLSVATPSQSQIASNTTDGLVSSTKTNINAAQDHTRNMPRNIDSEVRKARTRTYTMSSFPMESSSGKMVSSKVRNDDPSPGVAVNKDRAKVLARSRHSYHGPVDEHKMPKGSSPGSSHVHPKLPEYDDFVAKLQTLKAENKGRRRFSIF